MAVKKPSLTAVVNRAFQVKPLIEDQDGKLHWVIPQDVYRDSLMEQLQTAGEAQNLKEIGSFTVEIPTGLRQWPQPKQFQILPEIPREMRKDASAFTVNFRSASSGEDGYEVATITVYSGQVPDGIKQQPVYAKGTQYLQPVKKPKKEKPAPVFNAENFLNHGAIIAPEPATFAKKPKPPTPPQQ